MNEVYPTSAYDLLEGREKQVVDEYVSYAIASQREKREAISGAMYKPIPHEYLLKTHGLLNKPVVRAAVAERIKQASDMEDMSPDKVVREYINIGTSDIGEFIEMDSFGNVLVKNLNTIDPVKRKAIKSVETKATAFGISSKLTLHDKLPALRALSDMMGLTPPDKPPVLSDYVGGREKLKAESEDTPEIAYAKLLESA